MSKRQQWGRFLNTNRMLSSHFSFPRFFGYILVRQQNYSYDFASLKVWSSNKHFVLVCQTYVRTAVGVQYTTHPLCKISVISRLSHKLLQKQPRNHKHQQAHQTAAGTSTRVFILCPSYWSYLLTLLSRNNGSLETKLV